MSKYAIKSYTLELNGEKIGETMYPIDTIIRALNLYEEKYSGMVNSLSGKKTVQEIVEEMIKWLKRL